MEYYYNTESFDITLAVEKFQGKNFDDLFENQKVISNGLGELLEISWECKNVPSNLPLKKAKKSVLRNLKTVYYIGEYTEEKLLKRGIQTLFDLRSHLKYRDSANKILNQIRCKDYWALSENNYLYDIDTSFCFNEEDLLFIDIETMGLYDSPIIICGIGCYQNNKYNILQYFARGLEEEIAMCEEIRNSILPKFKCFVSYNGKSFDIPYLANRFLYYFDENPMLHEDDIPYKNTNTKFAHIDLYHNCRRRFKFKFENYQLETIEEELLDMRRKNELPSHLVGMCYRKYLEDSKRYIGLIKEAIEHNYYDLMSLPLIMQKLLL